MSLDLRRAAPRRAGVYVPILVGLALAFAALATAVVSEASGLIRLDNSLAIFAHNLTHDHDWLRDISLAVSWPFYTVPLTVIISLGVVASLLLRQWRFGLWLAASGLTVTQGIVVLKNAFARPRPVWDDPIAELGSYSFPSGHGAAAGMVSAMLVLLVIVLTRRGARRVVGISLAVLLGFLIGASRILLGLHYLSDVLAGACLGVFVVLAWWFAIMSSAPTPPSRAAQETGRGQRQAAIVVNPAKIADLATFRYRALQAAIAEGWHEPVFLETSVEDPGHGQTQQALADGVDLVIAAGGDGTVRAVTEELAGTGTAIGIVPLGTGNLLARNLDIPLNPREALEVAFGGQDRALDVGTFTSDDGTETAFLVMAGVGLDAAIMHGVNEDLKERVGWLAYLVSLAKALRLQSTRADIFIDDDEPIKLRARTVVVGNVGFLQGGIPLMPDAEFDDGRLDVAVITSRRFWGSIAIVFDLLLRRRESRRIVRLTGSRVRIVTDRSMPMQLDGDPVGEGREFTATVRPGVVLARVPVRRAIRA